MRIRNGIERICKVLRLAVVPVVYPVQPWIDGEFTLGERLKIAVTPEEYDGLSNEVRSIVFLASTGLLGGLVTGGTIFSMNQFIGFMKTNHPQQFATHLDAKDALRKVMERGSIQGSLEWGKRTFGAALVFAVLWNFIPVIRNKIDWHEHVVAGVVGGTVAGILHSDPKQLGLEEIKNSQFNAHRRRFILRSSAFGLLGGVFLAAIFAVRRSKNQRDARNWRQYRKQNNLEHDH